MHVITRPVSFFELYLPAIRSFFMFRSFVIFFLFIYPFALKSQILPLEGSSLNYRIIGFSAPLLSHTENYQLEIALGYYNTEDSFKKNIIKTFSAKNNKIIAEVPLFGKEYTWRAKYVGAHSSNITGDLHHFSTKMNPCVDTSLFRLRILKNAEEYKDAFVFLDDSKVMYDMKGNPVWFLPPVDGIQITPRDIKLSPEGTITLLFNPPYEVNYNGAVLWKAPMKGVVSGDYNENCHHEFTRLKNGHYMVLGIEYMLWKQDAPYPQDTIPFNPTSTDSVYKKTPFGTIIEYDEKGNVVWSWKSSRYFRTSDLKYFRTDQGSDIVDAHENAFFFDEKNKFIYVSFKNISRIIKVKYPEGTVVSSYGENYKPGVPQKGNGLFCGQHACNISRKGYLYMFNNNICNTGELPKITVLEEPHSSKDSLKKIWEYECTIEGVSESERKAQRFISGGSVQELPDGSIFACMNGTYSKIFIVNPDKKILWSGLAEKWNANEKKWEMSGQYRSYIVYDKEKLEQLIWNAADKKQ